MPEKDKNKESTLSEADKFIFEQAMKGVRPLKTIAVKKEKQKTHNAEFKASPTFPVVLKTRKKNHLKLISTKQEIKPDFFSFPSQNFNEISGEEVIYFHRPGLTDREYNRLIRGRLPIQASLDLHQMSLDVALKQCQQFISSCYQKNYKSVLLIHGKSRKAKKPILKNMLNSWLRSQSLVLAFHSAKPYHGGSGAMYLLLKNK